MQRLKVIDNSVENLASGAWQALGSAWKGSANFVQKYVQLQLNALFGAHSITNSDGELK